MIPTTPYSRWLDRWKEQHDDPDHDCQAKVCPFYEEEEGNEDER